MIKVLKEYINYYNVYIIFFPSFILYKNISFLFYIFASLFKIIYLKIIYHEKRLKLETKTIGWYQQNKKKMRVKKTKNKIHVRRSKPCLVIVFENNSKK